MNQASSTVSTYAFYRSIDSFTAPSQYYCTLTLHQSSTTEPIHTSINQYYCINLYIHLSQHPPVTFTLFSIFFSFSSVLLNTSSVGRFGFSITRFHFVKKCNFFDSSPWSVIENTVILGHWSSYFSHTNYLAQPANIFGRAIQIIWHSQPKYFAGAIQTSWHGLPFVLAEPAKKFGTVCHLYLHSLPNSLAETIQNVGTASHLQHWLWPFTLLTPAKIVDKHLS